MSTSRVPGVTRNSGWEAEAAKIVAARTLRQQQGLTTSTEVEPLRRTACSQI